MSIKLMVAMWVGCVMLVACGSSTPTTKGIGDATSHYLSVFFGQGELGLRLQRLWNPYEQGKDRARHQQLEQLGRQTLDRVVARNPGFLARFETELTSGDPVRVEKVLVETRQATEKALPRSRTLTINEIDPTPGTFIATVEDSVAYMESTTFVIFTSEYVRIGLRYLEPQTNTERLVKDTIISTVTQECYQSH
jgi:SdpC family antimicrobial peptide